MGQMVSIVDSTFGHANALGYAGEKEGWHPTAFRWDRSGVQAGVRVWTDLRLAEAQSDTTGRKIALLIESPAVGTCYQEIVRWEHVFDRVLTFHADLLARGSKYLFYPLGGSWIRDWGMFPKSKMVSMLVSDKRLTEGHRLRHEASKLPNVDSYGNGVGRYVQSKAEALRDYRFAVIVENGRQDYYFSEKLIDCLSQGTVPLYWGCPSVGRFFDVQGIIRWQDLGELEAIVKSLAPEDYEQRRPYIEHNLELAQAYQCPEDWIATAYPRLLENPA